MIFRTVTENDLPDVAHLYKVCFNFEMSVERYNYWYKKPEGYTSIICEIDGKVVGHNAFIINNYFLNGKEIVVALSSGGMVDSASVKNPGLFLKLIQYSIQHFKTDVVMAFPNKKAEPFWVRILKFTTIAQNYHYITPEDLNESFDEEQEFTLQRTEEFLTKRTEQHPRYKYERMVVGDTTMIYKEYNGNAELVYISKISKDLVEGLKMIFEKGFSRVNIATVYGDILERLGFKKGEHNVFVYEWQNKELAGTVFECQMVDSDVF